MKKLHLYIFHYHLLPGGVCDVIMGWLELIAAKPEQIFPGRQLVASLVCGKPENVAELQAKFRKYQESQKSQAQAGQAPKELSCRFIVDEDLDYLPQQSQQEAQSEAQAQSELLASRLLQKYRPNEDPAEEVLWWVHNYHLGKNVVFTKALLEIIAASKIDQIPGQTAGQTASQAAHKILLQIHDFPECGRFANYNKLVKSLRSDLYPSAPNLCYATINKRDLAILRDAGLPEQRLFFLPNPLRFNELELGQLSELRRDFASSFAVRGDKARYAAEKPIALYPVRCIRRKNVVELGVLNLLAGEPWNIVCTLPGRSEREKPYSDLVTSLFDKGLIQGRCGVGLQLDEQGWSFDMLCAASELILCSSVMEGFGFTYFNPMYWNKALVARQLDVLEGFGHCFPGSIFYSELKIPLRAGNADSEAMYHKLRHKYSTYIAGLPEMAAANLCLELEQKLPAQMPAYIDFAFLSVAQQVAVLQDLYCALHGDKVALVAQSASQLQAFLLSCREQNCELLADLRGLENASPASGRHFQGRKIVAEEFAEPRLRAILQEVFACFEQDFSEAALEPASETSADSANAIAERVLRSFSKLEYNYAILWDDDYSL